MNGATVVISRAQCGQIQDRQFAAGLCHVRIGGARREAAHAVVYGAGGGGVVHVYESVALEVGSESHPEQAALTGSAHAQSEERL
jgi:hypothetical protein